jgi:hypothetical protein
MRSISTGSFHLLRRRATWQYADKEDLCRVLLTCIEASATKKCIDDFSLLFYYLLNTGKEVIKVYEF